MRAHVLFASVLLACGSAPLSKHEPIEREPPEQNGARAPWGVRFVRQCAQWSEPWMLATSHRVLACGNAWYDADGALVATGYFGSAQIGIGDRALFSPTGTNEDIAARGEAELSSSDLVVRDEELRRTGALQADDELARGRTPFGPSVVARKESRVVLLGSNALYEVDSAFASVRRVEGSEPCGAAYAIGVSAEGAFSCVTECDASRAPSGAQRSEVSRRTGGSGGVSPPEGARAPSGARRSEESRRTGGSGGGSPPEGSTCLRTLGRGEVSLGSQEPDSVARDAHARRWLIAWPDRATWVDDRGTVLETRTVSEPKIRAISENGEAIVAHDGGTELWRFEDGRTIVETLLDAPAEYAVFIGERIVLRLVPEDLVWLERGAPGLAAAPAPSAPPTFRALEPAVERNDEGRLEAIFRGGWAGAQLARSRAHVGAFDAPHGHGTLFVARIDPVELSRCGGDDPSWARAVAGRYLEGGDQRWARYWRDEDGHRVLRGHSYIGGCERTHIHVLVRETDDGYERWTLLDGRREDIENALGPIPEDAKNVPSAQSDRYEGDPSIGALR